MKQLINDKRDEQLRREAFEAYARSCACVEAGGEFYEEGRRYAVLAERILSELDKPGTEDRTLLQHLKELFR